MGTRARSGTKLMDMPESPQAGLELAGDDLHDGIGGGITPPRRHRALGRDDGLDGFIQLQQLPPDRFVAAAAAGDLPDPHDGVVVLGEADRVNLDIPCVAVIAKLENVSGSKGRTSGLCPHFNLPKLTYET